MTALRRGPADAGRGKKKAPVGDLYIGFRLSILEHRVTRFSARGGLVTMDEPTGEPRLVETLSRSAALVGPDKASEGVMWTVRSRAGPASRADRETTSLVKEAARPGLRLTSSSRRAWSFEQAFARSPLRVPVRIPSGWRFETETSRSRRVCRKPLGRRSNGAGVLDSSPRSILVAYRSQPAERCRFRFRLLSDHAGRRAKCRHGVIISGPARLASTPHTEPLILQ